MSVPATLLLMQVTRGYRGGGGLPPEDKRTEKEKRRERRIIAALIIIGALCGAGVVYEIWHSLHHSAEQMKVMYAPSPRA